MRDFGGWNMYLRYNFWNRIYDRGAKFMRGSRYEL
jgi:hypothetical protein